MAMAGTILTFWLWNFTPGMSNIIASAGLALAVGLFFKKHFDIFFWRNIRRNVYDFCHT